VLLIVLLFKYTCDIWKQRLEYKKLELKALRNHEFTARLLLNSVVQFKTVYTLCLRASAAVQDLLTSGSDDVAG
jgi:hypothetical protein